MRDILVPVSPGDLLDKITILRIKAARIDDPEKLRNVEIELGLLSTIWRESVGGAGVDPGLARALEVDEHALESVNEKLWDIEDRIRETERAQCFDDEFIELARAVYLSNDERAAIKKRINLRLGSRIIEEKSYAPYRRSVYSAPQ